MKKYPGAYFPLLDIPLRSHSVFYDTLGNINAILDIPVGSRPGSFCLLVVWVVRMSNDVVVAVVEANRFFPFGIK